MEKTIIGVLCSHDNLEKNASLVDSLNRFAKAKIDHQKFAFVFTGGTYDRVINGGQYPVGQINPVSSETRAILEKTCEILRLPLGTEGGIIFLSELVVKRIISIIWFMVSPRTSHWLNNEDLALIRLCDHWSVKRLMNEGSVDEWIKKETKKDIRFNSKEWPIQRFLAKRGLKFPGAFIEQKFATKEVLER